MKFVPDLLAVNRHWCDHEILLRVEISLIGVSEVRIVSEEVLKLVRLGLEFTIFVLKHTYGSSGVDNKDPALIFIQNDSPVLLAGMNLFMEGYLSD